MARDLLEESLRGLPCVMAGFPYLPADASRRVPYFGPRTARIVGRLEFCAD
jgi:hypothetical protein